MNHSYNPSNNKENDSHDLKKYDDKSPIKLKIDYLGRQKY